MNDLKPFKHGEEGTHSVCNKHNIGGKSVCCECSGKDDCGEMTMTDTEKILAEFDSLYEEQKEILDIPVCCTEEDCLCNKDTVWEHLKSFLATSIAQAEKSGKDH